MKIRNCLLSALTVSALGVAAPACANLLTNGSFENGVFTDDGNGSQTLPLNATTITGWTVASDQLVWIRSPNPWGLSADDGDRFLDLTAYTGGAPFGGISQSIDTTIGSTYILRFALGSYTARWGGPLVSITASAGDASQTFTDDDQTQQSTWTTQQMLFTATASSTLVTLTGAAGFNYIGLDSVSVLECPPDVEGCAAVPGVPVPATIALLAVGAFGLVRARRR